MLFSLLMYSIHVILPFLAVLIAYYCFKSLFGSLKSTRPLIVLWNRVTTEKIPIVYWENSIGRDKHCDIVLDSPSASRDHAVLFRRKKGWIISDTNSKTGVFLNGKKIEEDTRILLGDTITMGGIPFEVCNADVMSLKNFKPENTNFRTYSGSALLMLISIFQVLSVINICFIPEQFDYKPLAIVGFMLCMEWITFVVTKYLLKRNNFEIESIAMFLSGIGIVNLCGIDSNDALTQLVAMVIGILFFEFMVLLIKNADFSMKLRPYVALLATVLLAVNLIFGKTRNGSQNWIFIGGYSIQPSEFVKIAFIFFGTSTIKGIQTTKNLSWFVLFSVICMGALFLMGDFGTASIFFVTFILIAFMRSGSIRTVVLTCVTAALGVIFILKFKPYIMARFAAWRHVWDHVNDIGYQQTRVLTYSASGGLLGLGVGEGCLKYVFAAPSDLVFGMLCEEWGMILSIIILLMIVLMAIYVKKVCTQCRSTFYTISSCCAAGMIVFQMIMNVFGVTDILPLTGVTLPFVSMGGSSLISVWALVAFIKASDDRTYSRA
ncbi:MAG: FtsW/RodA/SpoVE family cell cycle protein [Acutalibacteraceae bacterium]